MTSPVFPVRPSIASANPNDFGGSAADAIVEITCAVTGSISTVLLALFVLFCRILTFIDSPPDEPTAAAQELLDEFVFQISDRCGVPLSNSSLALLNRYYLDELVDIANNTP